MPPREYFAGQERRRRRALVAERLWWLAVSAALVVVIAAAAIAGAAVDERTCAACHRVAAADAEASAHANVRCDACHAGSGAAGLAASRIRVIEMVAAAPLSGATTPSAYVANEACLRCHAEVLRGSLDANGLRMSHRELDEARWSCVRCHASAGHRAADGGRGRYTMGMCLECHKVDPRDIDACGKCHPGGDTRVPRDRAVTPWAVAHGESWKTTHGMGELSTCKACHTAGYCVECHDMEIPHPLAFRKTHGREVAGRADGRTDCLVCHKADSCDSCHGIEMPHPDGFLAGHSVTVAESGRRVCERCHDPASCEECHTRHIHPGLTPQRIDDLNRRPVGR